MQHLCRARALADGRRVAEIGGGERLQREVVGDKAHEGFELLLKSLLVRRLDMRDAVLLLHQLDGVSHILRDQIGSE